MNQAILHHYRRFRKHQFETYSLDGEYINGRNTRKFSGGGAAYGYHATAAYLAAKRHTHFMKIHRGT